MKLPHFIRPVAVITWSPDCDYLIWPESFCTIVRFHYQGNFKPILEMSQQIEFALDASAGLRQINSLPEHKLPISERNHGAKKRLSSSYETIFLAFRSKMMTERCQWWVSCSSVFDSWGKLCWRSFIDSPLMLNFSMFKLKLFIQQTPLHHLFVA